MLAAGLATTSCPIPHLHPGAVRHLLPSPLLLGPPCPGLQPSDQLYLKHTSTLDTTKQTLTLSLTHTHTHVLTHTHTPKPKHTPHTTHTHAHTHTHTDTYTSVNSWHTHRQTHTNNNTCILLSNLHRITAAWRRS